MRGWTDLPEDDLHDLPTPPHTSPHLPTPPHTSPRLPTPPHISRHLPASPHISRHLPAQGWLDLPEDELHEKWVRRWFVLRNTVLNM